MYHYVPSSRELLLDILVVQRHLDGTPKTLTACPYCNSDKVHCSSSRTTLLGSSGPVDPNHVWDKSECQDCDKVYDKQYRRNNVWFTTPDQRVIKGRSNCFEPVCYTCVHCGGDVWRESRSVPGDEPLKTVAGQALLSISLEEGGGYIEHYIEAWKCSGCGSEIVLPQNRREPDPDFKANAPKFTVERGAAPLVSVVGSEADAELLEDLAKEIRFNGSRKLES